MNNRDQELFEAELPRLKPARPSEEFMARLAATPPKPRAQAQNCFRLRREAPSWWRWSFRWLAPAAVTATLAAALLAGRWPKSIAHSLPHVAMNPATPLVQHDDVEIDRQLVAAYDAVAQLPDGEPVRLLCREWRDKVTLRDPAKGIVIERQTPRLEVVPVSYDTY